MEYLKIDRSKPLVNFDLTKPPPCMCPQPCTNPKIEALKAEAEAAITAVGTIGALEDFRRKYLGVDGLFRKMYLAACMDCRTSLGGVYRLIADKYDRKCTDTLTVDADLRISIHS